MARVQHQKRRKKELKQNKYLTISVVKAKKRKQSIERKKILNKT